MEQLSSAKRYVVCVKNDDYPASLELRKIYETLPDPVAEAHHLMRVIDESDEDYLYPEEFFVAIDLPQALTEALEQAA